MIIQHPQRMYTLKSNTSRKIIEESIDGKHTKEVYLEYWNDYKKLTKEFNGQPWAKKCDLRGHVLTTEVSAELINDHVKWAVDNGLTCIALVIDSAITKMKMNRSIKMSGGVETQSFDKEEDAENWLRSKGF